MNSDIRLSVSFLGHYKRDKLKSLLGDKGIVALLDLWLKTAQIRPKGVFIGMDKKAIATSAGWKGSPEKFINALLESGFLEKDSQNIFFLHDWEEHQGWVYHSDERSEKAKNAVRAREEKKLKMDKKLSKTQNEIHLKSELDVSPSPNPSPSPSPSPPPPPLQNKESKHMCVSDSYSPDFEEFWKQYPHFNRDKKGTFKAYQATLKGASRINKATPEQLLRAARRYSEECNGKDKQYILHGTTFLGSSERWAEYDKPQVNMNGEVLREDIDPEDFREDGCVNYRKLEAARRGYVPYEPGQGKRGTTSENSCLQGNEGANKPQNY